jgi:hypothetical protein
VAAKLKDSVQTGGKRTTSSSTATTIATTTTTSTLPINKPIVVSTAPDSPNHRPSKNHDNDKNDVKGYSWEKLRISLVLELV